MVVSEGTPTAVTVGSGKHYIYEYQRLTVVIIYCMVTKQRLYAYYFYVV